MGSTLCVFAVGACAIYFPFACVAILFYLVMRKDKWCSAPVKHTAHLYLLCSCSYESVCFLINSWLMELFFTTYHYLSFLQPLTLQVQTFDIEHLFSALSKQKFNFKKLSMNIYQNIRQLNVNCSQWLLMTNGKGKTK